MLAQYNILIVSDKNVAPYTVSDGNLSIFFYSVSPMHLIPYSPHFAFNAAFLDYTCSRVGTDRQKDKVLSDFRPSRSQRIRRYTWLELPLLEEAYSPLGRTVFQRVRVAGRYLPAGLRKIQLQGLLSFLYASKRCSSRPDHRLCLLVRERPCSSSFEHPSSSLLRLRSLSLNHHRYRCWTSYSLATQEPRHLQVCCIGVGYASHPCGKGLPSRQSTKSRREPG